VAAERRADAVWEGDLASGGGRVSLATSGVAADLPVTWASRTERADGKTSPEELIAAAHAACFSMALSHGLSQGGNPPERLEVSATCTFAEADGGFKVSSMELAVRGSVPGVDADGFRQAAEEAKEGCPVSGALKGNVDISVEATLE
jgi:osmotically inducible protein OsmC